MQFTTTKIIILIASLMIALGPWLYELDTFGQIATPSGVGALLGIIGGVLLAWLGESPRKPKLQ